MSVEQSGVEHFTDEDITPKSSQSDRLRELATTMEISPTEDESSEEEDRPIFISKYFLQQMFNAYMDIHAYEMLQQSLRPAKKQKSNSGTWKSR